MKEILAYIAVFLLGVSVGICIYRGLIETMLTQARPLKSICDYCEYKRTKEELFPRK